MASMVEITVFMEADVTVQNPERVGKQASESIAKLLYETYVEGAKDETKPLVQTRAIGYRVFESVVLPEKKKK